MAPDGNRITTLLSNEAIHRLERLRITAPRRLTNRRKGEHLHGREGSSIEFSDYRDYVPGDDVRFVDWNLFARLNRPYMKLFHQEEELHVAILLDASSSMRFEGKFERAREIAAALGVMGLLGAERVSVSVSAGEAERPRRLPPCTGRASMERLFSFLERQEPDGAATVDQGIEWFLREHAGRGVAVVLSDFLTAGDLGRVFNLLFSRGLDIFALQILAPAEVDPDVTGDVRLVDCESERALDVSSAADLLALYQEYRAAFERSLSGLCRERGGKFLSIRSDAPLDWVLHDLLRRHGWVR